MFLILYETVAVFIVNNF